MKTALHPHYLARFERLQDELRGLMPLDSVLHFETVVGPSPAIRDVTTYVYRSHPLEGNPLPRRQRLIPLDPGPGEFFNQYLILSEDTPEAALTDPGISRTHDFMAFGDFLQRLEAQRDALIDATLDELQFCTELLIRDEKLKTAIQTRPTLQQWPWADGLLPTLTPTLSRLLDHLPTGHGELLRTSWPWELALRDVALWLRDRVELPDFYPALFTLDGKLPDDLRQHDLKPFHIPLRGRQCPRAGLALLNLAERDVLQSLRRPAMAIDAGTPHHALLVGWKDIPKDTRTPHEFSTESDVARLLLPGQAVQLTLNLPGLHEEILKVLKDWRGWEGVRHWAALLRLLSVEGGRSGWVRWTMDQHLDALGYSDRHRRDHKTLSRIAAIIEMITKIELCLYDKSGRERERRPLVLVGSKFDRLQDSRWQLDGMELQINPLLYRGVRDMQTGELGSNWHPAPIELAQVDHMRHPYTLALGLILPIRWRWKWLEGEAKGRQGNDLVISGKSLLQVAGIQYDKHRPGETWASLDRNLEELRRIGGIGTWEWLDREHTLEGLCRLSPADWMLDRTVRGLVPIEEVPGLPVLTGSDLKSWRKARGLTQQQGAELLGVGVATIKRAESRADEALTPKLLEAFRQTG